MKNALLQNTGIETHTFNYLSNIYAGFLVDIVSDEKTFWAFVYHKDIGVKVLMFGVKKETTTADDFQSRVLANIDDYIKYYIDDYLSE